MSLGYVHHFQASRQLRDSDRWLIVSKDSTDLQMRGTLRRHLENSITTQKTHFVSLVIKDAEVKIEVFPGIG